MELHSEEGTQRLELPVSRMTLKSWGGVPRETSEKSRCCQKQLVLREAMSHKGTYTARSGSW